MFSPEFVLDRIYEIDLYIGAGGSNTETFEFVDRTPESTEEIIEPFESSQNYQLKNNKNSNKKNL